MIRLDQSAAVVLRLPLIAPVHPFDGLICLFAQTGARQIRRLETGVRARQMLQGVLLKLLLRVIDSFGFSKVLN
ncbi:MAG: hypothetical protein EXS12_06530 [Phycisphaerales bacterium]|nr:hypothetical protein [Phycisphaerales bacterium]